MRILITGSDGFLGSNMVNFVKEYSSNVLGVDRPKYDLTNTLQVDNLIDSFQPTIIFHFAGLFYGSYPEMLESNLICGLNILESVKNYCPTAKVIIAGSAAEYGFSQHETMYYSEELKENPVSDYGKTKLAQTMIAKKYFDLGLQVTVARIFNIVGVGLASGLVVPSFIKRVVDLETEGTENTIKVGNIEVYRDFISVHTLVRLLWHLAKTKQYEYVINACSGIPFKIAEILKIIQEDAKRDFNYCIDPLLYRANDQSVIGDITRLKSLGWDADNEKEMVFEQVKAMIMDYRNKQNI